MGGGKEIAVEREGWSEEDLDSGRGILVCLISLDAWPA